MSVMSLAIAREQFTVTLSAVEDAVKFASRGRLRHQEYEEALAEARAADWSAWHGLVERGTDPFAVGVHGIATNAIRWVRARRKVGNTNCGRGALDIYHPRAQAASGFRLVSLDSGDEALAGTSGEGAWRKWLAEDNKVSPADEAAFRLDFEGWLAALPGRKRRVAELLAEGHEGVVVARLVGIAPSLVTQLRSELAGVPGQRRGDVRTGLGGILASGCLPLGSALVQRRPLDPGPWTARRGGKFISATWVMSSSSPRESRRRNHGTK